jgi:hypothetical protein
MLDLSLPDSFPLSVIMNKATVTDHLWETEQWTALAVVVGERWNEIGNDSEVIFRDELNEQTLFPGFSIRLHKDECESYYYNLLSEEPHIYVVCRTDETDNSLFPLLVSASYDEAAAYHETDDEVFTLPMPPELYPWLEGYVLENYVPEKKKKRKLTNWKQDGQGG